MTYYCPLCRTKLIGLPDPPDGAYRKFATASRCANKHYFMVFNVGGVITVRTASSNEIRRYEEEVS